MFLSTSASVLFSASVLLILLSCSAFIFKNKIFEYFSEQRIVAISTFMILSKIRLSKLKNVLKQLGWIKSTQFCLGFVRDKIYVCCGGRLNSVIIKDGHYILTYRYGITNYNIRWKARFGPDKVFDIKDENNKDVTKFVKSYLGPGEKFHGSHLCPNDLGFRKLTFRNVYKELKIFREQQIMFLV